MPREELRYRSRWMMRAMEWDEPRARYPNVWHDGMPLHVLAFERVASRLRLGDLIAVYYPASTKHPKRSNRFVGIARVTGIRRAEIAGHAWIDTESAHTFRKPLDLGRMPRRVTMCCEPGWPEEDVALFDEVFAAAVAEGWQPTEEEGGPAAAAPPVGDGEATPAEPRETAPVAAAAPQRRAPIKKCERMFAGADYSGDMRDPRESTWLALLGLEGDRLRVLRLEATGRAGLEAVLRNPDPDLMNAEAIGLGFPFGLPLPFAETLLGGSFPEEGWWALARRLEQVTWPNYLTALHEFRDSHGEVKRFADEHADVVSPLHRIKPDLGSRTYHGIRMIAEDRSRYAVRPFENAQGRLLIEVNPAAARKRMQPGPSSDEIIGALGSRSYLPLSIDEQFHRTCRKKRDALDAVIAARCAAVAVMTAEAEKSPEELAPDQADRVRREGWIYGLEDPA
jgi:hypothetical protein